MNYTQADRVSHTSTHMQARNGVPLTPKQLQQIGGALIALLLLFLGTCQLTATATCVQPCYSAFLTELGLSFQVWAISTAAQANRGTACPGAQTGWLLLGWSSPLVRHQQACHLACSRLDLTC